jgi:elongation factor 1-beta
MGNVQAVMTVMPTSVDIDLDELAEEIKVSIPETASLQDTDTEEVAFGLESLKILITIPDSKGGTDLIESELLNLEDVESVSVESVTRD